MRTKLLHPFSRVSPGGRHSAILAMGVGGLFTAVGCLMCCSLAGCQLFGESSVAPTADRSSGAKTEQKTATHVASDARVFSVAGVMSEPDMYVRIAANVAQASIAAGVPGEWKPTAPAPGASGTSPPAAVGPVGVVIIDPIGGRADRNMPKSGTGGSRAMGPLTISLSSGEWVVTESTGAVQRIVAEGIDVSPEAVNPGIAGGRTALIALNGSFYPGRLRLLARTDASLAGFDIIEQVPLETYLKGVVVKEMYPDWPLEAFRVQAICARSYALHERARGSAAGKSFDVEASQRDQAYSGATTNKRAIEAVESTRGIVLAFQSSVLRAYYSSSCGGRAGGARDTWPITAGFEYNLAAPIQAYSREFLCDKSSPKFVWVVQRDREELVKRLRAYGETNGMLIRKLENISSLEVLRTASTGRPIEYKIVEPGGRWFQLKAEDLRLACNAPVQGLAPITNKDRVLSGDIAIKVTPAKSAGGAKPKSPAAGTVEISGRGFGHGVGMCQYCVKAMADRGDDWRKMTMLFYPGAEIVRGYK